MKYVHFNTDWRLDGGYAADYRNVESLLAKTRNGVDYFCQETANGNDNWVPCVKYTGRIKIVGPDSAYGRPKYCHCYFPDQNWRAKVGIEQLLPIILRPNMNLVEGLTVEPVEYTFFTKFGIPSVKVYDA